MSCSFYFHHFCLSCIACCFRKRGVRKQKIRRHVYKKYLFFNCLGLYWLEKIHFKSSNTVFVPTIARTVPQLLDPQKRLQEFFPKNNGIFESSDGTPLGAVMCAAVGNILKNVPLYREQMRNSSVASVPLLSSYYIILYYIIL